MGRFNDAGTCRVCEKETTRGQYETIYTAYKTHDVVYRNGVAEGAVEYYDDPQEHRIYICKDCIKYRGKYNALAFLVTILITVAALIGVEQANFWTVVISLVGCTILFSAILKPILRIPRNAQEFAEKQRKDKSTGRISSISSLNKRDYLIARERYEKRARMRRRR